MESKIKDLLTESKALFLALDQGLEHGPKDFNLQRYLIQSDILWKLNLYLENILLPDLQEE